MAHVDGVPLRTRNPFHRFVFWMVRRKVGRMIEPVRGYALSFWVLMGHMLAELCYERARRLPRPLVVLAETRVSTLVHCPFCIDIGSALSREAGVPEAKLRDLHRWWESDAFTDEERLVLAYADRLTTTPVPEDPEQTARLRERFTDAELVELTNAIAHENTRARLNHGLGYGAEGFSEGTVCALPGEGAPVTA